MSGYIKKLFKKKLLKCGFVANVKWQEEPVFGRLCNIQYAYFYQIFLPIPGSHLRIYPNDINWFAVRNLNTFLINI